MVGDKCDGINKILETIIDKIDYDGEGKCFDVIAEMNPSCWTMFMGAGGLILVSLVSLHVSELAIHDRVAFCHSVAGTRGSLAGAELDSFHGGDLNDSFSVGSFQPLIDKETSGGENNDPQKSGRSTVWQHVKAGIFRAFLYCHLLEVVGSRQTGVFNIVAQLNRVGKGLLDRELSEDEAIIE
jgi:hypothetical protein